MHLRVECTGGQIDALAALCQHRSFCAQHIQVIAQPGLVALQGDGVGGFRRGLGSTLLHLLAAHGLAGTDAVGHLMHGLQHLAVVALNRRVQLGGFATQLGTQAPTIKQRQANGRAHAPLLAVALEEFVKADAVEPGKGHHIDVGVELCLGGIHIFQRGFHTPACGSDVGAAAQQIQRHGLGHAHTGYVVQHRQVQLQSKHRLGRQRRHGVEREGLLLFQYLNLQPGIGQGAGRLLQLERGV